MSNIINVLIPRNYPLTLDEDEGVSFNVELTEEFFSKIKTQLETNAYAAVTEFYDIGRRKNIKINIQVHSSNDTYITTTPNWKNPRMFDHNIFAYRFRQELVAVLGEHIESILENTLTLVKNKQFKLL